MELAAESFFNLHMEQWSSFLWSPTKEKKTGLVQESTNKKGGDSSDEEKNKKTDEVVENLKKRLKTKLDGHNDQMSVMEMTIKIQKNA